MIPLKTLQGLSPSELQAIVNNRDIYIWGNGPIGRSVLISMQKTGFLPMGFLDGRLSEVGKTVYSLPVFHAEHVIAKGSSFVIVANMQVLHRAEELCATYGRVKMKDYLTHYQISRPEAAVDISGECNVKCPSCPRGNMRNLLADGCMPFETYKKVLGKLLVDIPHLTNIELYTWGEPLLNPFVEKIVAYTEKFLPCTIATNLLITEKIEPLIRAKPTQLNVTINGYERQYEENMLGASWKLLLKNLFHLKRVFEEVESTTNIVLLSYGCNSCDTKEIAKIAKELNFTIVFGTSYLNPYENYARYIEKQESTVIIDNEIMSSFWNVDDMLQLALRDKDNPCLCQRVFPIINWDTSVALCHTYYGPTIAENYLEVSWEELLSKRHGRIECHSCQAKGLHRLDIDVLKRRFV